MPDRRRLAILAEGTLDFHHGKTAVSVIRYRPDEVVAVIDSANAGRSTDEVLQIGGETPIVASLEEALRYDPNALLIGIAPRGGSLPAAFRRTVLEAIERGLDIVSGLHFMLNDDDELARAARAHRVQLVDVRKPKSQHRVAELRPRRAGSHVITFVGSDCAVGKMTAALEVDAAARRRGLSSAFVATGQTGILLEGGGIPLDRIIGDFMAGELEDAVVEAAQGADWVFVEGQGSLLHPGYSPVTLALVHGSAPDGMILVHQPSRTHIEEYPIPIPPLDRVIRIYEEAAGWIKPAPVVGIAMNTRDLDEPRAREAVEGARKLTGLEVTDPVRFGADPLIDAVLQRIEPAAIAG